MAGITALNNIVRQRAAFGGIMGRDGRRQYGGGSDAGADGGYGYQGGDTNKKGKKGKGPASTNYATESGTVDPDRITTSREEFEESVDRRKLKRPGDTTHLKNKTIPDGSSLYYTGVPKSNIPYLGKYLNMAAPFRNKILRKNIDYFLSSDRTNLDRNQYPDTLQGYKNYMSDRLSGSIDAAGNTIYNSGGNDGSTFQSPIPYDPTNPGGILPVMPGETIEEDKFTYRMGDEQNVGSDVTEGYYAANGGRVPRAFGGIMDTTTGRRAYGLGSIFKSIKKAASKVLKSPIGKAAMLYGLGAMGGSYGLKGSLFSKGMFNPMNMKAGLFGANSLAMSKLGMGEMAAKKGLLANLGLTSGYGSFMPTFKGGITAMTALPLLGIGTEAKVDQMPGDPNRGGSLIDPLTGKEAKPSEMRASLNEALDSAGGDPDKIKEIQNAYAFLGPDERLGTYLPYQTYGVKDGGRIRAQEGGLMNLGGMEKDYRAEGGFVPIGREEKADDVPARLSVNEFVFTADAVRNAGGGDIDKGAEVMENMMKNLENGGRVSEESQGNTGAQDMFSVSERIGEVI